MLDLGSIPKVDEKVAAGINLISSISPSQPAILDKESGVAAYFAAIGPGTKAPDDIHILASSELGEFRLRFPSALLAKFSDIGLPQWREENNDSFFFKCRLIYAFQLLLHATDLVAYSWNFHPCEPGDADDDVLQWFQTTIEGESYELSVAIVECDLSELRAVTPRPSTRWLSLDPKCELRLPGLNLSVDEVTRIETGDAFIMPGQFSSEISATLALPRVGGWDCLIGEDGTVRISQRFQENDMDNPSAPFEDGDLLAEQPTGENDWFGADTAELQDHEQDQAFDGAAEIATPVETTGLSEIPVQIDFCLASHTFALSKLESLSPGQVLDLEIDLTAPIAISANGKSLGSGRLIQIGERIGVRVEHWQSSQGQSDA